MDRQRRIAAGVFALAVVLLVIGVYHAGAALVRAPTHAGGWRWWIAALAIAMAVGFSLLVLLVRHPRPPK